MGTTQLLYDLVSVIVSLLIIFFVNVINDYLPTYLLTSSTEQSPF